MNVEERRDKARIECYTIEEICDFFSQFYNISYNYERGIILRKTLTLYESDIIITLCSLDRPKPYDRLVHEITIVQWYSGKSLQLEYTPRYSPLTDIDNYEWFIVDRSITKHLSISKEDILMTIIDFIIENESKDYKLPVQLKRQLTLDKII
jgi:hypothetical protein